MKHILKRRNPQGDNWDEVLEFGHAEELQQLVDILKAAIAANASSMTFDVAGQRFEYDKCNY